MWPRRCQHGREALAVNAPLGSGAGGMGAGGRSGPSSPTPGRCPTAPLTGVLEGLRWASRRGLRRARDRALRHAPASAPTSWSRLRPGVEGAPAAFARTAYGARTRYAQLWRVETGGG